MLIVTNTVRFPLTWKSSSGQTGRSVIARSVADFLRYKSEPGTIFLIDCNPSLSFRLAVAFWFVPRPPLISVDLVLRQPSKLVSRLLIPIRRALLHRFDHHIHYFRDLRRLEAVLESGRAAVHSCHSSQICDSMKMTQMMVKVSMCCASEDR